jgi:pimeloyl-ACP methyl ester carboxylesterase
MEVSAAVRNLAKVVLYEPMIPVAGPITPPQLVDRVQTLSDAGEREEALTTFCRDIVRMPEMEVERARMLPSWSARIAAVHTIPRELREVNKYVLNSERFSRIAIPVLLLLGGDSPAFVSEGINAVHAAIPSSRVTIMPGQRHIAMDTAPAVFLREVIGFFGS